MDPYTCTVLDTMTLVDELVAIHAPDASAKSFPLVGGVELYVGAAGYYAAPIEPFFCAPFCETMQ